jgi:hypothetical protein
MRTAPKRAALALALAAALATAGCSSSSNAGDETTTESPAPTVSGSGAAPGTPGAPASSGARWQPRPGVAWQWQLTGTIDMSVDAPVYDIDGFENGPDVVSALHAKGRKVICYINVGAYEDFRPDKGDFLAALLGRSDHWEGEKWLDIRRIDQIRPIMAKRFDMCRAKGFDAVEPDQLDGYANDTGFKLTANDQLAFNRMIARLAHERGLAVGLKNDLDQVDQLVGDFDFAVNEQCAQYQECERLSPFVSAGKAVFQAEYEKDPGEFCGEAQRLRFSAIKKHLDLDAWRKAC